jgi:hypothetical protein
VRGVFVDGATTRYLPVISSLGVAQKMLSILVFSALTLAAALQAILTLFGRRHAGRYCVANRRDANVAGVVAGDNAH